MADTRAKVKGSSLYKPFYEYLEKAEKTAEYYKQNPQEHLQEILRMKMNGELQ